MSGRDGARSSGSVQGWALAALQAGLGLQMTRHYRSLPRLTRDLFPEGVEHGVDRVLNLRLPGSGRNYAEHVSVIVPARDEAQRIGPLLRSLGSLEYPDYEVVVVDDASEDNTSRVAEEGGARVIRIDGPPAGWTGKSYACWVGAQATEGEWLLFTDADTVHSPESLALAVRLAEQDGVGLLSLLPRQICRTFWERLLVPYAFALYFAGAGRINLPGGTAVANGQYLLVRREVYDRIGGHKAVREWVIEDVALARAAVEGGVRVVLARAEEHVSVRMYQDLPSLWEGFGKNAARFVSLSPRSGIVTVLAGLAFASAVPAALRQRSLALKLALGGVPAVSLLPWVRRAGINPAFAALYPLAAAVFQTLALDSIRRALTGGSVWKGRRY